MMPRKEWESHPSYGLIGASRVSGNAALFQSDIKHQHYVIIRINTAERARDLHRDWPVAAHMVTEIAMSQAQWAEFVSSMNQGDGVPCTFIYKPAGDFELERVEQPPFNSRLALHTKEVRDTAKRSTKDIEDAYETVAKAFADGAGRKEMREALSWLGTKIGHFPSNAEFATKSLNEHVEQTVAKAKADIEAHVLKTAHALGLTAGDFTVSLELDAGSDIIDADEAV